VFVGTQFALTLGDQTEAARSVNESAADFADLLKRFGEELEGGLSSLAFSAIATFGEGIGKWFEAAKPFPEGLVNYSKALAAVDSTTAEADRKSTQEFYAVYEEIAALMGGDE
jgi:putative NADP-dependent malic enzyme